MTVRTGKDFSHCNPRLELEKDVVLAGDLEQDLYIDNGNLEEEFLKQPELYAWWASVCELAKDLVAKQKFALERLAAVIDHKIRTEANIETERLVKKAEENGKKFTGSVRLTEKQIEHCVNTNEDYQKAMFEYLELKKQLGMLQAGKDAIEQRKDMLVSLGANYRAEASSNPSILKDAARERARKAAMYKEQQETVQPKKMPVGKKPIAQ